MLGSIVTFVIVLAIILLVLKVLKKSTKVLVTFLVNALVGYIVLFVLNLFGLGISTSILSSVIVGCLGVPGLVIILILQFIFHITL